MGARGVHFALAAEAERRLLAAAAEGDDSVIELIEEIEEEWERPYLVETDKAWDAIHRCLSDGSLDLGGGAYPLSHAILGGRQLYDGEDYFVCYVPADQVRDVAGALEPLDEAWLRERYLTLDPDDYGQPIDDEDFVYTWANLRDLADFFVLAAGAGRAVIFTVDQ
jgi:hypothetical protein